MSNIIIGKHTLESLTTGMYADPYVVFREYVQNAADAIDNAVRQELLPKSAAEIVIHLSPTERTVVISDNGTGISVNEAEQTLISIGNSKKHLNLTEDFVALADWRHWDIVRNLLSKPALRQKILEPE